MTLDDSSPGRAEPEGAHADAQALLDRLTAADVGESRIQHVRHLSGQTALTDDWPDWVPLELVHAWSRLGIERPWPHQIEVARRAWDGESVVIATGTASGKSLAYQTPLLASVMTQDRAKALYISPTKALASDQLRALNSLGLRSVRAATLDGDTPNDERDWVRQHANVVLTNPDMLHRSVLPQHAKWATLLRRLRFVVIDECHHYRGLFGSHVSLVIRRLRRLCALYGASPVFILASATSAQPAEAGRRLIGQPVQVVDTDLAPRGARSFVLWEPPLTALRGEHSAPLRRTATAEAARLLADLVIQGARTLVFVRSRKGAEVVALNARRHLEEAGATELAQRVAAYRSGYLAEERRALEADLASGVLLGVASTNALELGVDIVGLDAVVLVGYPGTLASLWQQAGRAGRRGQDSIVVMVARDDPLDTYLVHHPAAIFDRPVEATVTDPTNPYVLGPQLCCAASEQPIADAEVDLFGGDAARVVLDQLVADGRLRRRHNGWYWTDPDWPMTDIRGSGGTAVTVVEAATGTLLGTVEAASAPATVHPSAVYLHQGQSFVVDALDLEHGSALVHREEPDWTTTARDVTDIAIVESERTSRLEGVAIHFGTVNVSRQVVSFQRRRLSGEIIDETPLDMPVQRLKTKAVWYTLDELLCEDADLDRDVLPGALHAAEHAAIGLLPLFATCDRWDIGGVSTALHADTGRPTVFVYDGHQGGAGFAARGHEVIADWLAATRDAIEACECPAGCPSCVQSPKCGNGNNPLDKRAAIVVLNLVLGALDRQ